jgi:putative glutamine amidotransferase
VTTHSAAGGPASPVPRVGITCGTSRPPAYYETYARAVAAAGAEPVLLPVGSVPPPEAAGVLGRLDGLLLPGGCDVDPALYGEERGEQVDRTEPQLDHAEVELVRGAVAAGLPVLGICRGQQLINVALGGTLHQHVTGHDMHGLARSHLAHSIDVEADSELGRAAEAPALMVNSLHHQAVKRVAPRLRVTARSPDGVVEALEDGDRVVAVQCHPEELVDRCSWAGRLLRRFVERAGRGCGASMTPA